MSAHPDAIAWRRCALTSAQSARRSSSRVTSMSDSARVRDGSDTPSSRKQRTKVSLCARTSWILNRAPRMSCFSMSALMRLSDACRCCIDSARAVFSFSRRSMRSTCSVTSCPQICSRRWMIPCSMLILLMSQARHPWRRRIGPVSEEPFSSWPRIPGEPERRILIARPSLVEFSASSRQIWSIGVCAFSPRAARTRFISSLRSSGAPDAEPMAIAPGNRSKAIFMVSPPGSRQKDAVSWRKMRTVIAASRRIPTRIRMQASFGSVRGIPVLRSSLRPAMRSAPATMERSRAQRTRI